MNWLAAPTLALGFCAFLLGRFWSRKVKGAGALVGWILVLFLSMPAIVYAAYYSRLLGEPLWLYNIRAFPGSELLAGLAGFAAGWIEDRVVPRLELSRCGNKLLVPALLAFGITIPYLKPLLRPLSPNILREHWRDGVCLQSSPSTCGPASAATILRYLGMTTTEREFAQECFTSSSGTENWYLARALRKRNLWVSFGLDQPLSTPLPAILGVKLKAGENAGHFIAVLERQGDRLVVADPLEGRSLRSLPELEESYFFTGFYMSIQKPIKASNRAAARARD